MSKTEHNSPPAGTGNAPGLGESFSINLSTGQGTYAYQLPLPDGVAGHGPKLVLEYTHGGGNGGWGLGWRLPLRSIARPLDFGTPEGGSDDHFLDGGAELMPLADGTFRAVREAPFSRYQRAADGWLIEERNGLMHELGLHAGARVANPAHPERVVEWFLERTFDVSGNEIRYTYLVDQGIVYPASIRYAVYEVRFSYEARSDVRHDGRAGFPRGRALRCARIELILDPGADERAIRTYRFVYQQAQGSRVSLLAAIEVKVNGAADGSPDVLRPTTRFSYSEFDPQRFRVRLMDSVDGGPPELTDDDVALVTLDNAPLPGVLINRDGREYYWANRGQGRWAPGKPVSRAPIAGSFRRESLAFVDMDGSGRADLMVAEADRLQGYYENNGTDGWGDFVAFPRGTHATPSWGDRRLRLVDVNNDGLIDALGNQRRGFVWWRNGGRSGWRAPQLVATDGAGVNDVSLADPDVHLADMTGDGGADLVRVRSGAVVYWPGLGPGRFGEMVVMRNSPRLRRDIARDALLLVDLDGDGCADLVHVGPGAITIWQNQNGEGFADPVVIGSIPIPLPGTVRALNMNGHAAAGLVWNSRGRGTPAYVQFEFVAEQPPYLLAQIENGAGLVSQMFYRSAVEDYLRDRDASVTWHTNFPFPYLVVGRTLETDEVSGRRTEVEFRYHEAHFESHTRQFQGFRQTERIERGDASRPDTRQVHQFLMAQERLPGNGPEHSVLNGMLARIEIYQLDGTPAETLPYRVEISEYGLSVLDTSPDDRKRSFVFVALHSEEHSERTTDSRVESKTYTFDANGNVVRETLRGSGVRSGVLQPAIERSTEVTYAVSAGRYLLDKPARVLVRDADGTLLSEKRFYYDGPAFDGLPLGQAARGLCTREEEWVLTQAEFDTHYAGMNQGALEYVSAPNADAVPSVFATSRRRKFDARGLLVAARDAMATETSYVYDADGLFRTQLTDPLGDTAFEYQRATGQIVKVTYADGAVMLFEYDAQGRMLRNSLPGQTLADSATVYSYDESVIPNKRTAFMRQAHGATSIGVAYFDGLGKEFQQRVEVEPGRFLVSGLKLLNPWGVLRAEFEPTFEATAAFSIPVNAGRPSRRFFYDACGRLVRSVNYNDGIATAQYSAFAVVLRDANDNDDSPENQARGQFDTPREEEFDVLRQIVRVTERIGGAASVVTNYAVGPVGELLSVSDRQGVKFRYRYDRRACRLSILLRESGERKVWYDARKQAVRTLDAAGHDLTATWDAVGRQRTLASGATLLESYTYDTVAQHAQGRLAEVHHGGGRQRFTYDIGGRLIERQYFFDGLADSHRVRFEYDALGRETARVHEDGTRIERVLTFNGWVKQMPNIIASVVRDPRGFASEIVYQNGVRTTYAYTPGVGRIAQQTTVSPTNVVYEQVVFTYDKMEVMLARNDSAPGGNGLRQYTHDPLYQLTSVASTEEGMPLERRYDYASDYNLQRSDEAAVTMHYADAAHPDRLSGLTPNGGALFAVDYDGNGNLLHLPEQSFHYNEKNELLRFERADGLRAEYSYDHLGLRTSKAVTAPGGALTRTLFVDEMAEIRDGTPTYFVALNGLRVAAISDSVRFLHDNGMGSTSFLTDAAGARTGAVDYQPFGNAHVTGDVTSRIFSLHPVDEESGLVYMRRRYYAPQLGRFLTPDLMAIYKPESFLHRPQGLHLYAFVANDPLDRTDPTGLSFWSFVGSVVGVVVGVVVAAAIVAATVFTGGLAGVALGLAMSLAVTGVSYIAASAVDSSTPFGQFVRGFMIGFNAGMNGVLASAIFGPTVGIALGVINFLATFEGVSKNATYQGVLGWSSWLMPMSWGMTGIGLLVFTLNVTFTVLFFQQWSSNKIDKIAIDWDTGAIITEGGLLGPSHGGFSMGNFVLESDGVVRKHETGHTLNVAAFGSAFNLWDALNETGGSKESDYGETLAESHGRPGGAKTGEAPTIPMWG